jgi:hypothetical protein
MRLRTEIRVSKIIAKLKREFDMLFALSVVALEIGYVDH